MKVSTIVCDMTTEHQKRFDEAEKRNKDAIKALKEKFSSEKKRHAVAISSHS